MRFQLNPLPYAKDALEPHLSAETLDFHYEKHHRGYVEKLRAAIEGKPEAAYDLVRLVRETDGSVNQNAAQIWNHDFYWRCMSPRGGGRPGGDLLKALESSFGSFESFRKSFAETAKGHFGSGWAWLVMGPERRLQVRSTADAGNPLQRGLAPLLTLDVWEHAYYIDYRNERPRYVEAFLEHLVDWDFVARNLSATRA